MIVPVRAAADGAPPQPVGPLPDFQHFGDIDISVK